jgi:hypothetical protein
MKSSAKRLDDSYLTRNDEEDGKLFRFPILPRARDHCTSARLGAQTFAFGCGLVGDLGVMSAVRQALDCTCSAIPELGGGRITQWPAAHGLA